MAKKKEPAATPKSNGDSDVPVEVLALDTVGDRYPIIRQAVDWAYVLKTRQEFQHLKRNEILELALGDVLSRRATPEKIAEELDAARKLAMAKVQEAEAKPKLKLKDSDDEGEKETEKKKSK